MDPSQLAELQNLANTVCEYISQQVTDDKTTSDVLSYQVQLKIESTRLLKSEYEARLDKLNGLKLEHQELVQNVPEYAIELEQELRKAKQESDDASQQLETTRRSIVDARSALEKLSADEIERIAGANAMFQRQRHLVLAWEKALALRIEPHEGYLIVTYTDINRSFRMQFRDSVVHIEQEDLPQAVVGQIADQFNENGSFAQLAAGMRETFLAQSSS